MTYVVALALILAVFLVADVILTNRIVKAGGMEKNPLVRWVMARLGKLWWLVKLPVPAAAFVAASQFGTGPAAAGLVLAIGIHAYAVWHNWRQIRA